MTNWRKLEATIDKATCSRFGESVLLSFLKDGEVDMQRPALDVIAILHCGSDHAAEIGAGFTTYLSAGKAELLIDRSTYSGPMPKKLDRVRANERRGTPWWEVAAVNDRYSNLLVLSLNEA